MDALEKEQADTENPIQLSWHSYELRPKDAPPPSPEYLAKVQANRPRIYGVARNDYGLEMNPGPFGINSRPLLIGAKYAEKMGHGPAYHAAVMTGYWSEAKAIDDLSVLADVAESVGLDRDDFLAALEESEFIQQVSDDFQQAFQYGLGGVPVMIFMDKYLVSGAQPLEVLRRVVDQVSAELAD